MTGLDNGTGVFSFFQECRLNNAGVAGIVFLKYFMKKVFNYNKQHHISDIQLVIAIS